MSANEIAPTGYWNPETAHIHHCHSPTLADYIMYILQAQRKEHIIDFGCGLGNYLAAFKVSGFKSLIGVEAKKPVRAVFHRILEHDLSKPLDLGIRGNVLCLEVGEHIPKEYEGILIDTITKHCNGWLIMSWAIPGQVGFGHVNCKSNEEVIAMIEGKGFVFRNEETALARIEGAKQCPWFAKTVLVFKNENSCQGAR